ncbi:MAG: ATP-binding cassette domain-containing protein [Propioniciclava sp.]|uniref:ABC transporter ATP-binding protein n=1 Tax=Propioniciclava sp. TaxID=2038686 RepID=UPI0039E30937
MALDEVDLCLSARSVALLGPNGAGKSTLLGLATTVLPVQRGRVAIQGSDLGRRDGRAAARRVLGYVPQSMSLPGGWSCEEFLAYACWMHQQTDYRAGVERALAGVGLGDQANSKIRTLSGGMRQRLCVAQALVHRPEVLIVDEPTVGLDPLQRVRLREVLKGLDCQLVVATHLVDDVAALAEHVVVLDAGRVVYDGSIEGLCSGTVSAATVEDAYVALVRDTEPA